MAAVDPMAQDSGHSGGAVQAVKQAISADLLDAAAEAGVDVDAVIEDKLEQHASYGPDTVARFVSTAVRQQIEAAQAEKVQGIIMGSRDRHAKNWPRRHSLLRSNADHLEVSTWDGALAGPGGEDVRIPTGGAIVQLRVEHDEEYDSYEGKGLESAKQLDQSTLVENLVKVAVHPGDLTAKDEYDVVAVRGTVRSVNAQTVFEDGEPAGDGEVLIPDARDELQPHFEVVLNPHEGTLVRGHFERQKYGRPYFQVPDFEQMCEDAADLSTPDEQASFLSAGLEGLEVILVGNVNSFDKSRTDEGQTRRYVDIGGTALVATEASVARADAEADAKREPESEPEAEAEAETEPAPDPEDPGRDIHDVREDIEQFARLTGEDLGDLTVTDIQEKAAGIDDPEEVIRAALENYGAVQDDGTDDGQESDDPFDGIYDDETGMYHCPAGGCLAQASTPDELKPHVLGEHVDQQPSAFDLEEWVQAKVMGDE